MNSFHWIEFYKSSSNRSSFFLDEFNKSDFSAMLEIVSQIFFGGIETEWSNEYFSFSSIFFNLLFLSLSILIGLFFRWFFKAFLGLFLWDFSLYFTFRWFFVTFLFRFLTFGWIAFLFWTWITFFFGWRFFNFFSLNCCLLLLNWFFRFWRWFRFWFTWCFDFFGDLLL